MTALAIGVVMVPATAAAAEPELPGMCNGRSEAGLVLNATPSAPTHATAAS